MHNPSSLSARPYLMYSIPGSDRMCIIPWPSEHNKTPPQVQAIFKIASSQELPLVPESLSPQVGATTFKNHDRATPHVCF